MVINYISIGKLRPSIEESWLDICIKKQKEGYLPTSNLNTLSWILSEYCISILNFSYQNFDLSLDYKDVNLFTSDFNNNYNTIDLLEDTLLLTKDNWTFDKLIFKTTGVNKNILNIDIYKLKMTQTYIEGSKIIAHFIYDDFDIKKIKN